MSLPGKPELAVYDGEGHVFVNIESDPGQLVRIAIGDHPDGAGFDPARQWVLVVD